MTGTACDQSDDGTARKLQESILETLMVRLGAVTECLVGPVRGIADEKRLRFLLELAREVDSLDEFERSC